MANAPYPMSSMFNGSSHNTFNETTFVIQSERIAAFDRLEKAASPSAFHSFVGRPQPGKCYPNTRVDLLEGLEKWAMGMELPENLFDGGLSGDLSIDKEGQLRNLPIMWLTGGAGAGKSAVAQTFAERCEDLGHIVASFFFFSADPTRNHANRLVATLAYQIAQAYPVARARMEDLIHEDPHIFDKDFNKQFASLIVDPLRRSIQMLDEDLHHHRPCTIIIDGLDECTGGDVQAGIIRAVCQALRIGSPHIKQKLPRFLICSRPEEPIAKVFHSSNLLGMYTCIDLSSHTKAYADVYTFLKGKFAEIKETHRRADLIPASWPPDNSLFLLAHNSSGHFIYADAAVKFVSTDSRPVNALDAIAGLRASPQRVREPFAALDRLYHHILSRALEDSKLDTVRLVCGFLAAPNSPASGCHPDTAEKFLDLQEGELDTLLGAIPSLVSVESGRMMFYHKSFHDFLYDECRGGQFHIDKDVLCAFIWARCLAMVSEGANHNYETCNFIWRIARRFLNDYDFAAGNKIYSLTGMIQRWNFFTVLMQLGVTDDFSNWAERSFRYLLALLHSRNDDDHLIYQAMGVMIHILKDLVVSYPILLLLMSQQSLSVSHYRVVGMWTDYFAAFLSSCHWKFEEFFPMMERCLTDERMGHHRLTGDKFAGACLVWTKRLTQNGDWFASKHTPILQNQRNLILKESARRQETPFRWRRTKQALRQYHKNSRSSCCWGGSKTVWQGKEKFNSHTTEGSRCFGSPMRLFPRRSIDNSSFLIEDGALYISSAWRKVEANEQIRRPEFSFVLSRIPPMLGKASKSDAVAALRFKALPPLAICFPKLAKRARRAMEKYAIRHGYPAVDRYFKNAPDTRAVEGSVPEADIAASITGLLSHEDTGTVVSDAPTTTTYVLEIQAWLKCLSLRLSAVLGGLDEIYVLSEKR